MTRPDGSRPTYQQLKSRLGDQRLRMADLLGLDPKEIGIEINAAHSGLVLHLPIVELVISQLERVN